MADSTTKSHDDTTHGTATSTRRNGTSSASITSAAKTLIKRFAARLSIYTDEERERVMAAARRAAALHDKQKRASGEPYIIHPLQVAEILIDRRMDSYTIAAALLHDVLEDTVMSATDLRREFGREIEALVRGVTKINLIRGMSKSVQKTETIRKMLFAMVKDIRVILIKLADKLHNMRTLQFHDPESQKRIARECLDIYCPLAGRLGMYKLKTELEDLALKHLHPQVYEQIRTFIHERKSERTAYLDRVEQSLYDEAENRNLDIQVVTRDKHFYSVYSKMKERGKPLEEIYDLLGTRILCENESACYEMLGIVHKLWMPIDGRFKDYIAMPKSNQYRSLHTTVMGFDGKVMEIQIRTHAMDETAENGVAAHWAYKDRLEQVSNVDLTIINKLRDWQGARAASAEFLDEIKHELLKDSIYVFTPNGDVVELPNGSTPIDFAFHIHTEIGLHCIGAKADGIIIPLSSELKNTQVIDILTSPNAHPHLNWLRATRTARARQKVRHWLTQHDPDLIFDRNLVAKKEESVAPVAPVVPQRRKRKWEKKSEEVAIRIRGERNMMIRPARCCEPSTGDRIIGYISRGRGIMVHRVDCSNLRGIKDFEERKIAVEWESIAPNERRTVRITARSTAHLFSEIESAIRKHGGRLLSGKLDEQGDGGVAGAFTVEMETSAEFRKVLKSLRAIPAVEAVQQHTGAPYR